MPNINMKWIQAGQPRPYADSIYSFRLTCTLDNDKPLILSRDNIKALIRVVRGDYHDKELSDVNQWWMVYLDELTEESPGVWFVKLVDPYKD